MPPVLAQLTGADVARMVVPTAIALVCSIISGLIARTRQADDRRTAQLEEALESLGERLHALDKELALLRKDAESVTLRVTEALNKVAALELERRGPVSHPNHAG